MKQYSRRQALIRFTTLSSTFAIGTGVRNLISAQPGSATDSPGSMSVMEPYPPEWLPKGIRSRFVAGMNGLRMHVLEAGYEEDNRPGILLLHGFPELAYSWRNVMAPLAEQGYHVMAPDQRGYGRTTG